jgi:hypothetical protein
MEAILFLVAHACLTFYVVLAALAKFGVHVGNMKLKMQNEE